MRWGTVSFMSTSFSVAPIPVSSWCCSLLSTTSFLLMASFVSKRIPSVLAHTVGLRPTLPCVRLVEEVIGGVGNERGRADILRLATAGRRNHTSGGIQTLDER